jgi:hypothetical protein
MTKLTLSMEPDVVAAAKRQAKRQKTSVSKMFAQYVMSLELRDWKSIPIGPKTRAISGIVTLPPGKDYQDIRDEALEERYGKLR